MLWIVLLVFFSLIAGINYLILRSRPADRQAIANFLAAQQQDQVSVRRGWRWLWDHVEGQPAISALAFPSRATRVYVLVSRSQDGQLHRWRVGFDPWSRQSGLLVLAGRPRATPTTR